MEIKLQEIPIRDIVKDYMNNNEDGVIGYGGQLDIRPKYQREFIYKDKQRDAVIETIRKGFPLNVMYWVKSQNGTYEVMDGQQRTISFCEYVAGNFTLHYQFFHNLEKDEQEQILNYKTMIYFCEGASKEKLDWFKTINIAGEKLTEQEMKNAVYSGEWTSDAKRYFSKTDCGAYRMASKYMAGSAIRQDYLEATIRWVSKDNIEQYMATHQHDPNANELWLYFQRAIHWVEAIFPKYRKEMKGVPWGFLYNDYENSNLDPKQVEAEVARLMEDEDVTNKKGIYSYIFDRAERHLSIREFSLNQRREAYERQHELCAICAERFNMEGMEADHITPWHDGGRTIPENCQMLCKTCNRIKGGK